MTTPSTVDIDLSQQIIDLIKTSWQTQTNAITTYFDKYPAASYDREIAPGRNKATYVFGHLIATNDGLLPLLGFGDKLFPELEQYFTPNTPWHYEEFPTVPQLKAKWEQLNRYLDLHFGGMQPADWLGRHTKVSEADFALDPKRNKLNVLLGRTTHMSYHLGQLNILKHV